MDVEGVVFRHMRPMAAAGIETGQGTLHGILQMALQELQQRRLAVRSNRVKQRGERKTRLLSTMVLFYAPQNRVQSMNGWSLLLRKAASGSQRSPGVGS
jgi:hypothetical protein